MARRWTQAEVDAITNGRNRAALGPKQSKHRNRKTTVDGITFDSAKEARRYQQLRLEQLSCQIAQLRWQVPLSIRIGEFHICDYVADFVYWRNGAEVVEDVKSKHTRTLPEYRLKRKLVRAVLGLEIIET